MSDFAIHLSVSTQPEQAAVGVFELDHAATIEFFDRSEPSFGGNRIQLTYLDGINNQDSGSARLGDLLCVSNLCVSDPGVFESITSIASVDPGLLAYSQPTPVMDNMNIESSLHALKSELLGSMPKLQLAMNGELAYDELLASATLQPAKPRPKRLKVIKAKSGADRMKAATAKASGGGGQVLKGVSAEEGAQAILKLLIEEGVVR